MQVPERLFAVSERFRFHLRIQFIFIGPVPGTVFRILLLFQRAEVLFPMGYRFFQMSRSISEILFQENSGFLFRLISKAEYGLIKIVAALFLNEVRCNGFSMPLLCRLSVPSLFQHVRRFIQPFLIMIIVRLCPPVKQPV